MQQLDQLQFTDGAQSERRKPVQAIRDYFRSITNQIAAERYDKGRIDDPPSLWSSKTFGKFPNREQFLNELEEVRVSERDNKISIGMLTPVLIAEANELNEKAERKAHGEDYVLGEATRKQILSERDYITRLAHISALAEQERFDLIGKIELKTLQAYLNAQVTLNSALSVANKQEIEGFGYGYDPDGVITQATIEEKFYGHQVEDSQVAANDYVQKWMQNNPRTSGSLPETPNMWGYLVVDAKRRYDISRRNTEIYSLFREDLTQRLENFRTAQSIPFYLENPKG